MAIWLYSHTPTPTSHTLYVDSILTRATIATREVYRCVVVMMVVVYLLLLLGLLVLVPVESWYSMDGRK